MQRVIYLDSSSDFWPPQGWMTYLCIGLFVLDASLVTYIVRQALGHGS